MVLRKLQIPIKDIVGIFQSNDLAALIKAFVQKINSINVALSELRTVVDDFLQQVGKMGITKISAIPLLYEEMEKRLAIQENTKVITMDELTRVGRPILRPDEIRIIRLASGRYLSSRRKDGTLAELNGDNMQNLFAQYDIIPEAGLRESFFVRQSDDQWLMLSKLPDTFDRTTPYEEVAFSGGLYVVVCTIFDELDAKCALLREWCKQSEDFALDADEQGILLRDILIEDIIPWDIARMRNRYQQDIFMPICTKF